jgi:hypothetical protein
MLYNATFHFNHKVDINELIWWFAWHYH